MIYYKDNQTNVKYKILSFKYVVLGGAVGD